MSDADAAFVGSIPQFYDRCLGPILFDPYAADLVDRLPALERGRVLELACGTGILTRRLRDALPATVDIVASDLNDAMIAHARTKFNDAERVTWVAADATLLPMPDDSFDTVLCQFGFMFFPDKLAAFRECRRVLHADGTLLFNVWDSIDHNDLPRIANETIRRRFADDPPTFYLKPFSFHDRPLISSLLADAGFDDVSFSVVSAPGTCVSPQDAAIGLIKGNPVGGEIQQRDPAAVDEVIDDIRSQIVARFGDGPAKTNTQALVYTAVSKRVSGRTLP